MLHKQWLKILLLTVLMAPVFVSCSKKSMDSSSRFSNKEVHELASVLTGTNGTIEDLGQTLEEEWIILSWDIQH